MNCSQFTYGDPTEDKLEAYRTLIQKSREEGVKLILSSDAHITYDVGDGSEFLEIYADKFGLKNEDYLQEPEELPFL